MTSVEWLIQQLQAPCRGIPSHIIEQAKEMHEQELHDEYVKGYKYLEEYIGKVVNEQIEKTKNK